MVEVIYRDNKSPAQRISDRLKPSASPDVVNASVTKGSGPTRTISTVHYSAHEHHHGPGRPGAGNIAGSPNTPMRKP